MNHFNYMRSLLNVTSQNKKTVVHVWGHGMAGHVWGHSPGRG